jgi:hypothetical protein
MTNRNVTVCFMPHWHWSFSTLLAAQSDCKTSASANENNEWKRHGSSLPSICSVKDQWTDERKGDQADNCEE